MQTNQSAGELAPDLDARQDTDQFQNGARALTNRRCLIGGGTKRSPGTWYEASLPGPAWCADFIVNQATQYVLAFGDGRVDAFVEDVVTGHLTAAGSVTGALWTGAIWRQMDYVQSGNTAFLFHPTMPTQVLTRTGVSTWAVANFTFFVSGPRTEQPYFKVAAPTRTLQPSALTSSITLTISGTDAWFVAAHVGQIVRYLGRQCIITAVAGDGLSCTATVQELLPSTNRITVGSSAGFTVNELVTGATTGANGIIGAIPDSTHLDVISTNQTAFAGTEIVVGPQAKSAMSGTSPTTSAAVTDWDEALCSPVFGYPACGTLHRNRLLFGGHAAVPDAMIGSKFNNLFSFDVDNASDGDAIFETIGDSGASVIVQMHSAEQLIVATDHGLYYVPETISNPFTPTSISFIQFGSPWPITATAKMRAFDDGVMCASGSLIIKARPTGNIYASWVADEVSLLASHLVSNPTRLAVTSNFGGGPERYAVAVNDDGTLMWLQLVEAQKIRNMTPRTTAGMFTSVAALGKHLFATSERSVAGGIQYYLELFDQDVTLDLTTEYATKVLMDAGVPSRYGATAVNVITSDMRYHLGVYPPSLTNLPIGPYQAGLFYDSTIETLPPVIQDQEGDHAGEPLRICQFFVRVRASARFSGNGTSLAAYDVIDDVSVAPPQKDGWYMFEPLGWGIDPTITLNQPDPLPFEMLAIKSIVVYGS